MAVVGRADIIVRAITTQVADDIKRGFDGVERQAGQSGSRAGKQFSGEFNAAFSRTSFGKVVAELKDIAPGGEAAAEAFTKLVRKGYYLQAGLGAVGGSIGSVIGGLGALIGSAGLAAASVVALGGALSAAITGFALMKFALGGIGEALKETGGGGGGAAATEQALKNLALTVERNAESLAAANENLRDAQVGLNEAYKEGAEYLQQLGFEAEDAALSQERAAMSLEEARENLARVQDLPPNSRARREAELAFKEADLNYRQAADRSSDLATEQERYAQDGVEATDVVIDAKERLRQAEEDLARTVRDNLRAQIEAEEALAKARTSGAGAGASAYDKLTKSQKKFADFLRREIQPQLVGLREEVASGFLPMLEIQMRRLSQAGLFAEIRDGFGQVGDSLGLAVKNFTDQLMKSGAIEDLGDFFTMVANVMPKVGSTLGSVFSSILTIFDAASPLVDKFVSFIDGKAANFATFLDTKNMTGELETFFTRAGEVAGQFGKIFGNLFNGFGDIIAANFGPGSGGDLLLEYMIEASDGWANMNQTFLNNYFVQAAENTMALGNSLGILVDVLTQAGGSPEIEKFYNTINQGAFYFEYLVQEAVKTIVPLAEILRGITKLAAAFADSGAALVFLNVISSMANGLAALAQFFKPVLDIIAPVLAGIAALGVVFSAVNKIKTIFIGLLSNATSGLGKFGLMMTSSNEEMMLMKMYFQEARDKNMGFIASLKAGIGAAGGMSGAVRILGASIKAAFLANPLGIFFLALEGIMAIITLISGQIEKQFQARVEATTQSLKTGADAVDTLNAALGKTGDAAGKFESADMKSALEAVRNETTDLTKATLATGRAHYAVGVSSKSAYSQGLANVKKFRGGLDEVGASLAQLATTDIRAAQTSLQNFKTSTGATTAEFIELTGGVEAFGDEYLKSLQESAAAEGISIVGKNGLIDATLAMEYALGEGEVAQRRLNEEMLNSANATGKVASQFIDLKSAVDEATKSEKINWDNARARLEAQVTAAAEYTRNRSRLQTEYGFSEAEIAAMEEMGLEQAQAFAQGIIDGSIQGVDSWQGLLSEAAGNANDGLLSEIEAEQLAYEAAYAAWGKAGADEMRAGIEDGSVNVMQILEQLGVDISGMEPTFTVDTDLSSVNYIPKAVKDAIKLANDQANAVVIRVNATRTGSKNGGLIGAVNMQGFADGGIVSGGGFGGGRSDRVPAMLSNGEYVVNAMATAKNLSLLNKMNYEGASGSTGSTVNITVNPSPGMDERELASVVSQELMRQMRRGSI